MSLVYYVVVVLVGFFAFMSTLPTRKQEAERALCQEEGREYVRKPTIYFVVLITAVLVFVAGFRYYVGSDYGAYYKVFSGSFNTFIHHLVTYDEPGIHLVAFVAKIFWNDGAAVIFASSFITIVLYVIQIYKHSTMFALSILLYIFLGAWATSFNAVRQYLAAAVLLMGHRYILDRKFWKYLLFVFLASLFHISALVMIVPYFILTRKLDFKQVILLVAASLILRYSYDFIFELVGVYKGGAFAVEGYMKGTVNILRIAVAYAPLLVYMLMADKNNMTKEENFYMNCILFNAFVMFATMNSAYLARMADYSSATVIIGYSFLMNRIKDGRLRRIVIFAVLLLFAAFWWYQISISPDLKTFKWIWDR
ncbi:MAG: EpsG family protein [Eubacteriales bacterium]|nr:EpsG family protein [Eubacteriales bacterium]